MWFSKAAQGLSKIIYPVTRTLNVVGLVFLAVMMFLTGIDVFLRYIFNSPIIGSYEITEFIMAVLVAFGLAYTQVKKGHISVDVIISKLPQRIQSVINSVTCTIFLGLFLLISWRLILYAESVRVNGETTGTLFLPIFPFVLLVAIGSIILCLVLVTNLLEYLAQVAEDKKWWQWAGLFLLIAAIVLLFFMPAWGQEFMFKLSPLNAGIVGIVLLVLILFSGMPVGIVMGLLGFLGVAYLSGVDPGFTVLGSSPYTTASSYSLSVVPLFILMGAITFYTGMTKELYDAAYKWFGQFPGGLALATIGASAAFAAVSGSSVAGTATMGVVALPEMRRFRYNDALSTGSIVAGGTLAIMIPPSIILVLYGILTEQSIGKLLLAGFIPGIILTILYMIAILIMCTRDPKFGPRGSRTTIVEKLLSLKNTWAVVVLFLVVIGGLYIGIFTPTEAAGIGAFGAVVIGLARRRLKWKDFVSSLLETLQMTAMCFIILIGANIFGYFLAISRLPNDLSATILNLSVSPTVVMLVILMIYLFLGCLISNMAMLVLTVPIFFPVIVSVGFDPIWFGVIIVLVVEMGLMTPPVGMNVYVMHGIAKDVPMYTIFKGMVPFLIMQFLLVAILMIWPQIATFLPSMMK